MDQLFAVSALDVADTSDDCYTPRWIFDAAGLLFDMDVAAPVDPSRRICPARRYLTPVEDGLSQPWEGFVWCNPPYSNAAAWVSRLAGHDRWLGLFVAYHHKIWLGRLVGAADAIALISPDFIRPDGSTSFPHASCVIAGRGAVAISAVGRIAAADKYAAGAYHVRPAP
jgi:hypothetical protein